MSANRLIYRDNRYTVDFDDLKRKPADPKAKLLLLCNPQPGRTGLDAGRAAAYRRHLPAARGIRGCGRDPCELTYEGHDAIRLSPPCRTLPNELRDLRLPSKAFNLAGLQIADIVAADEQVRRRIDRAVNINEVCDVNPFGVAATIAAYDESGACRRPAKVFMGETEYLRRFSKNDCRNTCCRSKELTWSGSIAGRPVSARTIRPAFAERTETDGQFGHAVRPRRRRIHPAEYRLSPDAACRRTGTGRYVSWSFLRLHPFGIQQWLHVCNHLIFKCVIVFTGCLPYLCTQR